MARKWGFAKSKTSLNEIRDLGLAIVNQLLPSQYDALVVWKNLVEECKALVNSCTEQMTLLADDSKKRQRWRVKPLKIFSKMSEESALVWSGWWILLSPSDRRFTWNLINPTGVFNCPGLETTSSVFKKISDYALKYGDLFLGKQYKILIGINLLRDYVKTSDTDVFVKAIKNWVTGDIEHENSDGDFYELYRQGVEEFLNINVNNKEPEPLTVAEFLLDPKRHARTGTSDGERLHVLMPDGKIRKARKSKWASVLATKPEAFLKYVLEQRPSKNKSVGKREKAKDRAVIAGDLSLYEKMSYVSYWLEPMLKGHPNCPLFYNSTQMADMLVTMVEDTKDETIKMPLDQDQFDHQTKLKMISMFNNEIIKLIKLKCHNGMKEALLDMMVKIEYATMHATVSVGKEIIRVTKGLLSGFRWTALYGSGISAGENYACKTMVKRRVGIQPVLNSRFQGDDCRLKIVNAVMAVSLVAAYQECNIKINLGKFFVAQTRDEFLRQTAEDNKICGYASRAIGGLIFRNPYPGR